MGHYTELKVKAKLDKATPDYVISLLKRILIDRDLGHDQVIFNDEDVFKPDIDHEFFKTRRWYMLFLSTDWTDIQGGRFYEEGGYWTIDLHTQFKNYDDEIDKFIDWIGPWIVGRKKKQFIGWWKPEDYKEQFNIYIER